MNNALALTLNAPEVFAFPLSVSKRSTSRLSQAAADLMCSVAGVIDDLVGSGLAQRTPEGFIANRNSVFPKYFAALSALSNLSRIIAAPVAVRQITLDSYSEIEADLRNHGLAVFGQEVRDQALFTVWTLRRISEVCDKINEASLPSEAEPDDKQTFEQFRFDLMWTHFHLQCLVMAMQRNRPVPEAVIEILMDGLRAAVNAYAAARTALDLRKAPLDVVDSSAAWDDEDQALLSEADFDCVTD